jgi:starch phosphorylase
MTEEMLERVRKEFPNLPERLLGLGEMAENLWWSWHPAARMVFKSLNRQAWKENLHNPDKTLKELPPETLAEAAEDPDFLRHYDLVLSQFHKYLAKGVCSMLSTVCAGHSKKSSRSFINPGTMKYPGNGSAS